MRTRVQPRFRRSRRCRLANREYLMLGEPLVEAHSPIGARQEHRGMSSGSGSVKLIDCTASSGSIRTR